ncbi:mechanosensitive ion channel protein MscS [Photobacterium phosphoreum]|uniref:mechanosensitive ion channel family protein n=1 Tax=Photobacterium phosphoreum TaxID=659 RepID=UPI001E453396|nr:mechanosensitive ion channel family protein [Photobacterium phosphoreum]MCD9465307.1 mechanosensitive ion channel protein MscS [Photobacterium phosphoreum]
MDQFLLWWASLEKGASVNWIYNIGLLLLLSALLWGGWLLLSRRLATMASKTHLIWDDALIDAVRAPVSLCIWVWPGLMELGIMVDNITTYSSGFLALLRHLLLVGVFIWIVMRLITNIEQTILDNRPHRDATTVTAISKILRLLVMVLSSLIVMQNFGLSLSGLLTFGGVGGLVVGMAAKDLLANFFGGMMIYFDRPFKVGDWIRSPDRQIEGTIERIGFRMTVIRTFDKRPLYVPNSVFSSVVVENASRMQNRRIKQSVGLRYCDAAVVGLVVDDIKTMLQNHADIETRQTLIVSFDTYGPSSLNILVYTFTKTVDWVKYKAVQQDVMLQIVAIVHARGADFAFPTTTLDMPTAAITALTAIESRQQA